MHSDVLGAHGWMVVGGHHSRPPSPPSRPFPHSPWLAIEHTLSTSVQMYASVCVCAQRRRCMGDHSAHVVYKRAGVCIYMRVCERYTWRHRCMWRPCSFLRLQTQTGVPSWQLRLERRPHFPPGTARQRPRRLPSSSLHLASGVAHRWQPPRSRHFESRSPFRSTTARQRSRRSLPNALKPPFSRAAKSLEFRHSSTLSMRWRNRLLVSPGFARGNSWSRTRRM